MDRIRRYSFLFVTLMIAFWPDNGHAAQEILDRQTDPWGVKISNVEIKHVDLPAKMQRSMAKQAEAERERRAKVIHAKGEFEASETLANAAQQISSQPGALQLRFLQTMTDIASEQNSTILFPMPLDLLKPFLDKLEQGKQ
jgi:regulator of protease activity HflC (stomatin/prohibitin superfamily)